MTINPDTIGDPGLKNLLLRMQEREPRPTYYRFQDGIAARVSEFFEKPQELLDSFEKGNRPSFVDGLAIAALKLPALIGSAISRVIYFAKGEKIKKSEYDEAYAAWMQKEYRGYNENFMKKFIDTCIQNRIEAEECPYHLILDKFLSDRTKPLMIFSADGEGGETYKKLNELQKNALIIVSPGGRDVESGWKDHSPSKVKDVLVHIASYSCVPEARDALDKRCQAIYFSLWEPSDPKTVGELRDALTKEPKSSK